MIKIKPLFNDWREVDREQAKRFASLLYNHIKNAKTHKEKILMIQERVKGITVEELLGE